MSDESVCSVCSRLTGFGDEGDPTVNLARCPSPGCLGARVGSLLAELDDWIERAGAAERRLKKAEEVVLMARQLTAYDWADRLEDCEVSDSVKHDSRELSIAVWLYDQEAKS